MRIFHDDNVKIYAGGKEYEMKILQVTETMFSVDIKGLDQFTLVSSKGKFLAMSGQGMTEELIEEIGKFVNRHI